MPGIGSAAWGLGYSRRLGCGLALADHPIEGLHRRCTAPSSATAEEAEDPSPLHGERQIAKRPHAALGLRERLGDNGRGVGHRGIV